MAPLRRQRVVILVGAGEEEEEEDEEEEKTAGRNPHWLQVPVIISPWVS